ncbi:hypothetical protein B0I37DRAFT_87407 [Chaetomium sp. MPI-CAGE-AT-0009]|nr:hypothetical protein B0I37DRAFT_87407 [Chaetomium sp. MPI-CAGE-AT-0009]
MGAVCWFLGHQVTPVFWGYPGNAAHTDGESSGNRLQGVSRSGKIYSLKGALFLRLISFVFPSQSLCFSWGFRLSDAFLVGCSQGEIHSLSPFITSYPGSVFFLLGIGLMPWAAFLDSLPCSHKRPGVISILNLGCLN